MNLQYQITKTQDKKIDEYIKKQEAQIMAGNLCFDLDPEIIREYWGDEYAEFKFSDFLIIGAPDRDESMLCRGWFSDSPVGVDQVITDYTVYPEDIIIKVPGWMIHGYCILNVIKQLIGLKPDFVIYDMEAL